MSIMETANQRWRKFIDQLEASQPDVYKNLWLKAPASDPKVISEDYHAWRTLVQQAFFEGYEAGFTDRIFNGEQHD